MIVDALMTPLLVAVQWVVDLLPDGQPIEVSGLSGFWEAVAKFDSFLPVMGPVVAMLGVLSALAAFVTARVVLTVWNLIYP